ERREPCAELLGQPVGVGLLPHTAEDVEAFADENLHTAPANAGRGARHNHAFHLSRSRWLLDGYTWFRRVGIARGSCQARTICRNPLKSLTFREVTPITPAVCGQPSCPSDPASGSDRWHGAFCVWGSLLTSRQRRIVRPVRRMSRLARND